MARPDVRHAHGSVSYTDASGKPIAIRRELDTTVTYTFVAADGIPLVGPGAQAHVTYDADGRGAPAYSRVAPG